MLKTVYKRLEVILWLHGSLKYRKKHDSQEEYFVNDQGVVAYQKIFNTFFANEMSSLLVLNIV